MSGEIRILGAGDEALLLPFLEQHLESSIFLVSNAERAGLVDRGEPLQATYAACVNNGVVTAVAAHGWNGNVLVQGELGLEEAARAATKATGRAVKGIIGPLTLVHRTRAALGLDEAPVAPALRNGYARAAVAASLLLAREQGFTRSTLFTSIENDGAERAYMTLGYRAVSEFCLLLFR